MGRGENFFLREYTEVPEDVKWACARLSFRILKGTLTASGVSGVRSARVGDVSISPLGGDTSLSTGDYVVDGALRKYRKPLRMKFRAV